MTRPEFSLVEEVDRHTAELNEERQPDGMYHPSQFWSCLRQTIYAVRGEPALVPFDSTTLRRFRLGHIIHEFVQTATSSHPTALQVHPEFSVLIRELNITGHGDLLVELQDGTWVVVEIKSIRRNGFKYLPKKEHVKQASIYAVGARKYGVTVNDDIASGRAYGPEGYMNDVREWVKVNTIHAMSTERFVPPLGEALRGILLVYFEKEDLLTAEYWFPYDTQWELDIEERVAQLEPYRLDDESLPPCEGKGTWVENYCAFSPNCKKRAIKPKLNEEDW